LYHSKEHGYSQNVLRNELNEIIYNYTLHFRKIISFCVRRNFILAEYIIISIIIIEIKETQNKGNSVPVRETDR